MPTMSAIVPIDRTAIGAQRESERLPLCIPSSRRPPYCCSARSPAEGAEMKHGRDLRGK
jgi:hypothetical protein